LPWLIGIKNTPDASFKILKKEYGTYALPVGRSYSLRLPVFMAAKSISIGDML
jgi:hypothetical protein